MKLRSLEMLRAFAAVLVVLFHTQSIFEMHSGVTPFAGLFGAGLRGVDLFFVLSGFIIAYVHSADIGRPGRLGNYIFNRAARIYPAVWFMTLLAGGLYFSGFGGVAKAGKLTASNVAASMLLLPQSGDALVNVTWTLKYEMFFYSVFALMIFTKRYGVLLLLAWQISVLSSSIFGPFDASGLCGFYSRSLCLDFSVGLACAWLVNRSSVGVTLNAATQWTLLGIGITTFVGGMMAESYIPFAGIPCAAGAGAIITALVLLEKADNILVPNVLVMLGRASYSIYLVHFSVITLIAVGLIRFHALPIKQTGFLAVAMFGIAAGLAFDRFVDQPIQYLLRVHVKPKLFGARQNLGDRNGMENVGRSNMPFQELCQPAVGHTAVPAATETAGSLADVRPMPRAATMRAAAAASRVR